MGVETVETDFTPVVINTQVHTSDWIMKETWIAK